MKKSKWFLGAGISGVLAVVCFVVGVIASFNQPSGASYGVAQAFGDTSGEDFIRMLPNIMIIACGILLVVAIVLLVVGLIKKKKGE